MEVILREALKVCEKGLILFTSINPLTVSSAAYSVEQARQSIWTMDLEIIIVLISNTFVCVFVGLQLYHVKKNPEVLSFISLVMLVILTLSYVIPLVLNFEALFS